MQIDPQHAAGRGREPGVAAGRAVRPTCATRSRRPPARRRCFEAGAVQPVGAGAGADGALHGRGPAQGGRRADQRAAGGARLPPVSAPTAGVVGDIPVRVGDSVTRSTVLTTIDQNAGLEVYINVPVQEAEHLRVGLPVHLVDDARRACSRPRRCRSSRRRSTPSTQSVLAKATLEQPRGPAHRAVRPRAHGLDRGAGAHGPVRRREPRSTASTSPSWPRPGRAARPWPASGPLDLGAVVGNDYVVKSGPRSRARS